MTKERKLSLVAQAYERCKPARDLLNSLRPAAHCMEVIEDKAGILIERWYVSRTDDAGTTVRTVNLIVYATPHWWDVFTPIEPLPETAATLAAIRALAIAKPAVVDPLLPERDERLRTTY